MSSNIRDLPSVYDSFGKKGEKNSDDKDGRKNFPSKKKHEKNNPESWIFKKAEEYFYDIIITIAITTIIITFWDLSVGHFLHEEKLNLTIGHEDILFAISSEMAGPLDDFLKTNKVVSAEEYFLLTLKKDRGDIREEDVINKIQEFVKQLDAFDSIKSEKHTSDHSEVKKTKEQIQKEFFVYLFGLSEYIEKNDIEDSEGDKLNSLLESFVLDLFKDIAPDGDFSKIEIKRDDPERWLIAVGMAVFVVFFMKKAKIDIKQIVRYGLPVLVIIWFFIQVNSVFGEEGAGYDQDNEQQHMVEEKGSLSANHIKNEVIYMRENQDGSFSASVVEPDVVGTTKEYLDRFYEQKAALKKLKEEELYKFIGIVLIVLGSIWVVTGILYYNSNRRKKNPSFAVRSVSLPEVGSSSNDPDFEPRGKDPDIKKVIPRKSLKPGKYFDIFKGGSNRINLN